MKFLPLILVLFFCADVCAQPYHLMKEIQVNDRMSANDDIRKIYYKIQGDSIYQFRQWKDSLKIGIYSLESGKLITADTLSGIEDFRVTDIAINKEMVMLCGNDQFICVSLTGKTSSFYLYKQVSQDTNGRYPFSSCANLSDSTILLYTIYNYHPLDDSAGVYMKIYNTKSRKIDNIKFMEFPGVALTPMAVNWLTTIGDKIYIVNPLTGILKKYDLKGDSVGVYDLNIIEDSAKVHNIAYENQLDSTVSSERDRILAITSKYPKDSVSVYNEEYKSPLHGKKFTMGIITETKSQHVYIKSISTVDDSLLLFVISRPEYADNYDDLMLYSPQRKTAVKHIRKSPSNHADTIKKLEDIHTVILTGSKVYMPYIRGNEVYTRSLFSINDFTTGSYEEVSHTLSRIEKQRGYIWNILKYRLDW